MIQTQSSLLIKHFCAFYTEVVRLKGYALTVSLLKEDDSDVKSVVESIGNKIAEILQTNFESATKGQSQSVMAYYSEALFIMVVLADETFLTLKWPGRESWRENLLEVKFFNTHHAGEHFFQKLKDFLGKAESVHKDIAVLYLWALGLGFSDGVWLEQEQEIQELKKKLYALVKEGNADAPVVWGDTLVCPQVYDNTMQGSRASSVPSIQAWYKMLYITVGVGLILSSVVWFWDTAAISKLLNNLVLTDGRLR